MPANACSGINGQGCKGGLSSGGETWDGGNRAAEVLFTQEPHLQLQIYEIPFLTDVISMK